MAVEGIEIYNESTYVEFHLLLCELLFRFKDSLERLCNLKGESPTVEKILEHLIRVRIMGHYLKTMARSAAIETHLQSISNSLIVDINKSWMPPKPEEVNDTDFVDFQCFKPFSIQKGKTILPWESYRDWLMLMIHYFDAAEVLGDFASKLKIEPDAAISITILTPLLSNKWMLPWTELLENKHFFPVLPAVSSGRELIEFLNNQVEPLSNFAFFFISS